MRKEALINETRPHDSAFKHVSGFAEYTDDIKEPENTLYGAIGWSKKAQPCSQFTPCLHPYWP